MKIRYLLLLLFIPIIYTACQKEDEDNTNNNSSDNTSASIIGGWHANNLVITTRRGYYENYPIGKVVLETETETWTPTNQNEGVTSWYVDFKDNGECITTSIQIDLYYSPCQVYIEIDTNNYMKQGNTLIFLDDTDLFSDDVVYNIETLNNSTLTLSATENDTSLYLSSGPNPVQDVVYFTEDEMNFTFDRDN
tara:strand:+ start:624 stop:1202 length:579 start_codon:yes stop_codon:yes gene_type:complete